MEENDDGVSPEDSVSNFSGVLRSESDFDEGTTHGKGSVLSTVSEHDASFGEDESYRLLESPSGNTGYKSLSGTASNKGGPGSDISMGSSASVKRVAASPCSTEAKRLDDRVTPDKIKSGSDNSSSIVSGAVDRLTSLNIDSKGSEWADEMEAEDDHSSQDEASDTQGIKKAMEDNPNKGNDPAPKASYADKAARRVTKFELDIHLGSEDREPLSFEEWQKYRSEIKKILLADCLSDNPACTKVMYYRFHNGTGTVGCNDELTQDWYIQTTKTLVVDNLTFRAWKAGEKGRHGTVIEYFWPEYLEIDPKKSMIVMAKWNHWNGSFGLLSSRPVRPPTKENEDKTSGGRSATNMAVGTSEHESKTDGATSSSTAKPDFPPGWIINAKVDDQMLKDI